MTLGDRSRHTISFFGDGGGEGKGEGGRRKIRESRGETGSSGHPDDDVTGNARSEFQRAQKKKRYIGSVRREVGDRRTTRGQSRTPCVRICTCAIRTWGERRAIDSRRNLASARSCSIAICGLVHVPISLACVRARLT